MTASSDRTDSKCGPLQILWQSDTLVSSISICLQIFKQVIVLEPSAFAQLLFALLYFDIPFQQYAAYF